MIRELRRPARQTIRMTRVSVWFLVWVLCCASCVAAESVAVTLLGEWPGYPRGPAVGVQKQGDILYAALGSGGLALWRVANPVDAQLVSRLDVTNVCNDVVLVGDRAFLALGFDGLGVADVRDVTQPRLLQTVDTPGSALSVAVVGQTAYVADWEGGLQIIHVDDTSSAQFLGSYRGAGVVLKVIVTNSLAYLVAGAEGFHIVDVSDSTQPVLRGRFNGNVSYACVSGTTAYVAVRTGALWALDVSDPANLRVTGNFPAKSVSALACQGSRLYVVDANLGFVALDISNPTNLVELGRLDIHPLRSGRLQIDGDLAWVPLGDRGIMAVDAATPALMSAMSMIPTAGESTDLTKIGDLLFVADGNAGLQVLNVRDPAKIERVGSYLANAGVTIVQATNGVAGIVAGGTAQFLYVSDPSRISLLGEPTRPSGALFYQRSLTLTSRRAYLAGIGLWMADIENFPNVPVTNMVSGEDFFDGLVHDSKFFASSGSAVWIFDIANPGPPKLIGKHLPPRLGRTWGFRSFAVIGKVGYASTDTLGLEGVDLRDYSHPTSLGNSIPWASFGRVIGFGEAGFCPVSGTLTMLNLDNSGDVRVVQEVTNNTANFVLSGDRGYVARGVRGVAVYEMPQVIPKIVEKPIGGVVPVGQSFRLEVSASGGAPLHYQWSKDGANLSGATNAVLIIENFQSANAGDYTVSVSNQSGAVTNSAVSIRERNSILFDRMSSWPAAARQLEVSGKLVYLALGTNGIGRVDVSDPRNPIDVGRIAIEGEVLAVRVTNGLAYVASGWNGFRVLDLSAGAEVGGGLGEGYVHDVEIRGTNAFFSAWGLGIRVVDISDTQAPRIVGSWFQSFAPLNLDLGNPHLLASAQYEGLLVFDMSNPSNPAVVGSYVPGGYVARASAYREWAIASIGDYWGWLGAQDIVPPGVQVIDLHQPSRPASVARYPMSSAPPVVKVPGELAYTALETNGLQVLNLTEPTRPNLVGSYPAALHPLDLAVDGGVVYVVDANEGLIILKSRPETELFVHHQIDPNGQLRFWWSSGFGAVLQTTADFLPSRWVNYEDTSGRSEMVVSATNRASFFRLLLP